MTEQILKLISASYPLKKLDIGKHSTVKSPVIKFHIEQYHAEGLGNISVMRGSGMFGLMKMDTLIVNPFEVDAPLFSYDRIYAMGNDTLILELYDTQLAPCDVSGIAQIGASAADLPDHDLGSHWYDNIKYKESLSKKGQKLTPAFDKLTADYSAAYIALCAASPKCSDADKRSAASTYVEGLLSNGGPSTDAFKKILGEDETKALFRKVIFGTEA